MAIHPGSIWIQQYWATLQPGLWVCADANGVVSEARDYPSLLRRIAVRNRPWSDFAIIFIPDGIVQ